MSILQRIILVIGTMALMWVLQFPSYNANSGPIWNPNQNTVNAYVKTIDYGKTILNGIAIVIGTGVLYVVAKKN